jgi:hypothetical protein
MGNGALPHGPSYRAHPRLYRKRPTSHPSKTSVSLSRSGLVSQGEYSKAELPKLRRRGPYPASTAPPSSFQYSCNSRPTPSIAGGVCPPPEGSTARALGRCCMRGDTCRVVAVPGVEQMATSIAFIVLHVGQAIARHSSARPVAALSSRVSCSESWPVMGRLR